MPKFIVTAVIGTLRLTFTAHGKDIIDAWHHARMLLAKVGGYTVSLSPK